VEALRLDDSAKTTKCALPDGTYAKYATPSGMTFKWGSQFEYMTVTGESKTDYMKNLSTKVSANVGYAGFGSEFSRTWSDESNVETFSKYMAEYDQTMYEAASVDTYLPDIFVFFNFHTRKPEQIT